MALQLESQPRWATLCFARSPAVRTVRRQPLAVRAVQPDSRGSAPPNGPRNSAGSGGASGAGAGRLQPAAGQAECVELPGGALWWQHLHNQGTTPLYGSNFVLQRPTVGGPGLIKASRPPAPVRVPPPSPPPSPPVVWHAPGSGAGLGLTLASGSLGAGSVVVDTDFVVLPAQHPHPLLPQPAEPAAGSAVPPNTICTGIVWQRSADPEEGQEEGAAARQLRGRRRGSGRHPRRTQMVSEECAPRCSVLGGWLTGGWLRGWVAGCG